jgi:radical SAM superfamily enzyme YgiQ (UPF0313 family)
MKIYLVNPRFPLSLWDLSLCRDLDGSAFPFPPLSLATLAALTPRKHEVVVCDENVRPIDLDADADIIGITGYSIQKERVFELADAFRKRGKKVAIGGPFVQRANVEECSGHADAVFLGEAEYTWPAFLRDLQLNATMPVYAQEKFVDMSDSPAPRFDLLELSAYSTAIIETSRGCPHSCEFCEIPVRLGKGSRAKSQEQVMTEIRRLYDRGADSIFIIDDNFLGNRSRAVPLITEIRDFVRSVDYRLSFSCQFTIDTARDEALLSLLREANFRRVFIGIETPRQASLAMAKKRQNTNMDLLDAVRRIQTHNIIVWGAFIVGFDSDDTAVFQEQLDFIQTAAIPVAMVGILQALPGTPLHERITREGRLKENEAGGIRGAAKELTYTNIRPLHMTEAELAQGFRYLVSNLYDYDRFAERMIHATALGKKRGLINRTRIGKKAAVTMLRLLRYYLFTVDLRRIRMFVRLIAQTLIRNPQYLEAVLMHLVVYKHLKLFYEEGTGETMLKS